MKKKAGLGKSAKYYANNPKARKVKAATDKKINSRPKQKKKRCELGKLNREADKKGINRKGKDLSHTSKGLRYKSIKANRGSKSDTNGDKNARGSKRKKK